MDEQTRGSSSGEQGQRDCSHDQPSLHSLRAYPNVTQSLYSHKVTTGNTGNLAWSARQDDRMTGKKYGKKTDHVDVLVLFTVIDMSR